MEYKTDQCPFVLGKQSISIRFYQMRVTSVIFLIRFNQVPKINRNHATRSSISDPHMSASKEGITGELMRRIEKLEREQKEMKELQARNEALQKENAKLLECISSQQKRIERAG